MRFTILGVICAVLMVSCSDDGTGRYEVGSDFVDNNINVKVIDTFSINTGTYKLDSIITSGTNESQNVSRTGHILLGSINDPYLGKLTAQSYFQLQGLIPSTMDGFVYDSIGFVLKYDKYYYGDTLQPQTYKIHRILETVKPKQSGDAFYNTSKLKFDDEVLGEITFTPKPNSIKDSVYIPMKRELGEEIFNKIKNKEISSQDEFLQYFKGLAILPDTLSNSHVLGFNTHSSQSPANDSNMRVYYTYKNGDDNPGAVDYINFFNNDATKQFNAIKTKISDTKIKPIDDLQTTIVSSDKTNHLFFAQAGTGICARINMPSIKKLKQISELGTTLSAELSFKPLKGTYDKNNPLQNSLSVYIIDNKNRVVGALVDVNGTSVSAVLNEEHDDFESSTYYTVDLENFVETILRSEQDLNYSLMLQFQSYDKTVNRIIIEDPNTQKDRVKLAVKYLNY